VALVQAFQRALDRVGGGRVIVSDVSALSPTVYLADAAHEVPYSTDPEYVEALLAICRRERVGLLVPTIDDELPVLASAAHIFAAAGVRVAVSPVETTLVGNDKRLTAQTLQARGVPAASTWLPSEVPASPPFPLFVKPRRGRGGVGAFPARDRAELRFFVGYVPDAVVQPFLDGPEFTIDVLCDFEGTPLSVVPRERVVVRAGVVDRGRTVRDPRLIDVGLACARALAFVGAVNIQVRVVDCTPIVFEINPRFSGGIPLTIAAGADFPQVLVHLARGVRVTPFIGRFQDQLWLTSYESSLFVPAADIAFSAAPRPITEVA
jgi:carbamoyl-phosphate synthase large subunit